jgi:probable rRNA maturation factor
MKLQLSVRYALARRGLPSAVTLKRYAHAALLGLRRRRAQVDVHIVGTRESARLNARYRSKAGATNVLSFPFLAPPGARSDLLGDVVICAPVVRREAREQGKSERAHWAHMVVHGILHLRGYEHDTDAQAATMERREAGALRALGFMNPYT